MASIRSDPFGASLTAKVRRELSATELDRWVDTIDSHRSQRFAGDAYVNWHIRGDPGNPTIGTEQGLGNFVETIPHAAQ